MTLRTRVKICGITNIEDALWATKCGADALGFVLYEKSPRAVTIDSIAKITKSLPAFVSKVILVVNSSEDEVKTVLSRCHVDILQFHGDESREFCEGFDVPYIKAIRVKSQSCIENAVVEYPSAAALLLDTYKAGVPGGTGEVFNWDWVKQAASKDTISNCGGSINNMPIILAGGLTPDNVTEAITQALPFAVDVSGGVEASKGKKDLTKVAEFIKGVNSVQR